nr:purple acid phosphatase 2-like [Tanacetum cinerariifolium]
MRFYSCFLVATLCVLAFDDGGFLLLSHGGITSSYVRNEEKSVDMPFDSDVFKVPQGYNAPQQTRHHTGCLVRWIDPKNRNVKIVM